MIHVRCDSCGQMFNIPETCAGKTGRCSKCKGPIAVPAAETPRSVDPAHDMAFLDLAPKEKAASEATGQRQTSDEPAEGLGEPSERYAAEETDPPKRPWPMDAILYPLNAIGLIHLIGLWLLLFYLCPFAVRLFGLGMEYVPIVYALPVAYTAYYFAECIRGKAAGGRHVPDYWMHPNDSSRWDYLAQAFDVLACVAICFWPVSLYYGLQERIDWVYWLLLAGGGFCFPMILLAVVLHDSLSALNPILIVGSILRTFVPYCGMVLLFSGGALLFARIGLRLYIFQRSPLLPFLLRLVQLYMIFVAIALLGRFHQRHKGRLGWGT